MREERFFVCVFVDTFFVDTFFCFAFVLVILYTQERVYHSVLVNLLLCCAYYCVNDSRLFESMLLRGLVEKIPPCFLSVGLRVCWVHDIRFPTTVDCVG